MLDRDRVFSASESVGPRTLLVPRPSPLKRAYGALGTVYRLQIRCCNLSILTPVSLGIVA